MKNTLAENMLRFGSKNLDAKAVAAIKKLSEQAPVAAPVKTTMPAVPLTVSKIPEWSKIVQFYKANSVKKVYNAVIAVGNYLYVSEPTGTDGGFNVAVYQAQSANVGWGQFVELQLFANVPTDGSGNLKDAPMQPMRELNNVNKSNGAADINSNWNSLPANAERQAVQHVKLRKTTLKPTIDQIKQRGDLAELSTQLTGIAKSVYNEIIL